jgi:hypothetical protein
MWPWIALSDLHHSLCLAAGKSYVIPLWVVLGVIAMFVLLIVTLRLLGSRLPEEHVASMTLKLSRKPQEVWDVIADVAGHKHWARGVTKVERLPDRENHEVWRQFMGRNSFVLMTAVSQPPLHLVRTVEDDHHHFGGDWEYELSPDGEGTRLKLTEHGRVPNPVFRAMMHYLFGETTTIKQYLASLAGKFGEKPRLE